MIKILKNVKLLFDIFLFVWYDKENWNGSDENAKKEKRSNVTE